MKNRHESKNIPVKKDRTQNIYILLLAALTFIIYSQILKNDFVNFDDDVLIYENPLVIKSETQLKELFEWGYKAPHYKPLTILSWRLQYKIWGANPFPFHLFNLILHTINAILVLFICRKLIFHLRVTPNVHLLLPFILALIFAVHPMHVESVAWAVERKDVLFSFFFFSSWLCYINFLENKKYYWILISALLYGLSVLSKSMGITLVAVLFLTDWLYQRRNIKAIIIEKIPILITFIISLYLTGLLSNFTGHTTGLFDTEASSGSVTHESTESQPSTNKLILLFVKLFLWFFQIIFPTRLSVLYSGKETVNALGVFIFVTPLFILAIAIVAFYFRKRFPELLFGLAFFIITISPGLVITDIGGHGAFLANRYTYLAQLGIFIALATLLLRVNNASVKYLLFCMALVYGLICFKTTNVWQNSGSLWTQVIKVSPQQSYAYSNRGQYYRQQGDYKKALADQNEAIKYDSNNYKAYSNRSKIHFDQGKSELAIKDASCAIELMPTFDEAISNRGAAYASLGKFNLALNDFNKALEINPENTDALSNRSLAYYMSKNFEAALVDVTDYLTLFPNSADMYNLRSLILNNKNRLDDALMDLNQAIRLDPKQRAYYSNRSHLLAKMGRYTEALKDIQRAQQLGAKIEPSYISFLKENSQ